MSNRAKREAKRVQNKGIKILEELFGKLNKHEKTNKLILPDEELPW